MTDKLDIIWKESTDSTNEDVKRHIHDIDNLSVLAAEIQNAGRGQRGNVWFSGEGANLTFSIFLKPELKAAKQFRISQITALSIVKFLEKHDIKASVKWPNDIYVQNRKICGILIENTLRGDSIIHSIIGIGLNVNQESFPQEIPNPTSMLMETGKTFDLKMLLEDYIRSFRQMITERLSEDTKDTDLEYQEYLWRKDEEYSYRDMRTGNIFIGRITGISETGCLSVQKKEGEPEEFAFKEISYIL